MKTMIKKLFFIMLFLMAVAMLPGCADKRDPSARTVGIAMPTKVLERWNRDGDDSYDTDDKVSVKELMQMLKAELQ